MLKNMVKPFEITAEKTNLNENEPNELNEAHSVFAERCCGRLNVPGQPAARKLRT